MDILYFVTFNLSEMNIYFS